MTKIKHLIDGPISSEFVAAEIQKHEEKKTNGAHALFLGTVRADDIGEAIVTGIEYSAYEEMISKAIQEIKDLLFDQYKDLNCIHIYHSTGLVRAGEHSLFVMVSSGHRVQAFAACAQCVDLIKEKLPVWKRELFDDGSHHWPDH